MRYNIKMERSFWSLLGLMMLIVFSAKATDVVSTYGAGDVTPICPASGTP